MRAERGPDADLARALRDGERHQRVDPRRGKQEHAHRHQPDAPGQVAPERSHLIVELRQGHDTTQLQRRIDLGADLLESDR